MNRTAEGTAVHPGSGIAGAAEAPAVRDFVRLLKPRVMSLVVLTGLTGLVLAPGDLHPLLGVIAVLCIAVAAGAAGAMNMWYDADIDGIMDRTRDRPIPMGRIRPDDALAFGGLLAIASVGLMGLALNWVAAALLAGTIAFYVFVYTMWLKRRTSQNIVIGGAAGALPPVVGWAAVTGDVAPGALLLFLLIFFWTPPHFWALALYRSGDYARAGIPMLPVTAGDGATRRQILAYSVALVPLGILPAVVGLAGWVYGAVALGLGIGFVALAVRVLRANPADEGPPRKLFGYSILYLFLLFTLMIVDRVFGLGI